MILQMFASCFRLIYKSFAYKYNISIKQIIIVYIYIHVCVYIYIYLCVYVYIFYQYKNPIYPKSAPPFSPQKTSSDLGRPWQRPWHGTMMPWRLLLAAGVLAEDHWEEGEG